jgi:hypothetical protein
MSQTWELVDGTSSSVESGDGEEGFDDGDGVEGFDDRDGEGGFDEEDLLRDLIVFRAVVTAAFLFRAADISSIVGTDVGKRIVQFL